jgi:hypothetical protein
MVTKTDKISELPPERVDITPTCGSRTALETTEKY